MARELTNDQINQGALGSISNVDDLRDELDGAITEARDHNPEFTLGNMSTHRGVPGALVRAIRALDGRIRMLDGNAEARAHNATLLGGTRHVG